MASTSGSRSYYSGLFNEGSTISGSQAVTQLPYTHGYPQASQIIAVGSASGEKEGWLSSLIPSRQTLGLFGILACGLTLIGATTYFVTTRLVNRRRQKAQMPSEESDAEDFGYLSDDEDYQSAGKRRLKKYSAAKRAPPLITYAELYEQALVLDQHRNSQRTSRIYFDANDEYIREEQVPELINSARRRAAESQDDSIDELEEQQRVQDAIALKYRTVDIFFGNEDYALNGTTRITRNIFAGTQDRTENAMVFLDNLNKIKQAKNDQKLNRSNMLLRKLDGRDRDGLLSQASYPTQLDGEAGSILDDQQQRAEYNSDSGFESLDPVQEDRDSVDEDDVLLNISPNKFEKPKDQLYMDFFVKYTELFVNESRPTASISSTPKANFGASRDASAPLNSVRSASKRDNMRPPCNSQRMRLVATSSSKPARR